MFTSTILPCSYLNPIYSFSLYLSATTLRPHGNHWGFILSFSFFSICTLLSSVLVHGPAPNLCLPPCSTSAQLHLLFLSNSSIFLLLFHPLSPVQWPLSKCVFVSLSEAQCVSARWPEATHDQWSTAKTIRQGTPLLAIPPLLSFHHLWFCCFSFTFLSLLISIGYFKPKVVLEVAGISLS